MENKQIKRIKKKPNKKWTNDETIQILEYMKDCIAKNSEIEKPTATVFYNKMLLRVPLQNVTSDLIKNKVRNLKDTYIKAVKWKNEIGLKGLNSDDDSESFTDCVIRICPFWEQLNEIYGSTINIKPMYNYDASNENDDLKLDFEYVETGNLRMYENQIKSIIENDMSTDSSDSLMSQKEMISERNKKRNIDDLKEKLVSKKKKNSNTSISPLCETQIISDEREKAKIEIEERKKNLDIEYKKKQLALQNKQFEFEKEKFLMTFNEKAKIEERKINLDMDYKNKQLELQNKQFEFEKEKFLMIEKEKTLKREMDERLAILQIQKDERLAMFEIEQKYKNK